MSDGIPIVSREDLAEWHVRRRDCLLRIAYRHAPGETIKAKRRALRSDIDRILRGDLRSLGVDVPAESRMRLALLEAKRHGAIKFEERNMRRILNADIRTHDEVRDRERGVDDEVNERD